MTIENEDSNQKKGGDARAKKLTPEERSAIARDAALARWAPKDEDGEKSLKLKADFGSPDRPLKIGELEIPCYVLNDGRSVITQNGMLTALTMSQGTATKGGPDRLANFAGTKSISPFVSNSLREMITKPIRFKTGGQLAYGYEATILPELCDAVLSARQAKALNYQQDHIAIQCEILVRAFARVGIVALVHEATGYQEVRDRDALQEVLKRYISEDLMGWVRTFPLEFYKQVFRLKGWNWNAGKMSPIVGNIVNDLVYGRLAPGVLEELKRRNPTTEKGHREHQHFQHLTKDVGHPSLTHHLYELIGLAKAFGWGEWGKYYEVVNRLYPKMNAPLSLPFNET
jgi:hypothetical protein